MGCGHFFTHGSVGLMGAAMDQSTGKLKICPVCGAENIREAESCKQCGHQYRSKPLPAQGPARSWLKHPALWVGLALALAASLAALAFRQSGPSLPDPASLPKAQAMPSYLKPPDLSEAFSSPMPDADLDFQVRDLQGRIISMKDLEGQAVLLNIWATWCGFCVAEMPSVAALEQDSKALGIKVMTVSSEQPEVVLNFNRRPEGLPVYTVLGVLPPSYHTRGIPATFIIDRKGRVVLKHEGMADWNCQAVRDLLYKARM